MAGEISSDQIQKVPDRSLGYNLYEGLLTIPGSLNALTTGWQKTVTLDLSQFNLGILTPEVTVTFNTVDVVGGGVYTFNQYNCPLVFWDTNGLVQQAVYINVSYNAVAIKGSTPSAGTSKLTVGYYNRTSSTAGQIFSYKVKGSDSYPST